MEKTKKPRSLKQPISIKKARRTEEPERTERERIVWRIGLLDRCGKWGWSEIENVVLWDKILKKMKDFESMTWAEIKKGGQNHSVPKFKLCPDAQRWLHDKGLDDVDGLFGLRLSGKKRVYGIRNGRVLDVIWWDPNHTVCPARKKHT